MLMMKGCCSAQFRNHESLQKKISWKNCNTWIESDSRTVTAIEHPELKKWEEWKTVLEIYSSWGQKLANCSGI